MSFSSANLQAILDSLATALVDLTTTVETAPASSLGTIENGIALSSPSTLTRILALNDVTSEATLLPAGVRSVNQFLAQLTGALATATYYQSLYPFLDALETVTGGLANYLVSNNILVAVSFAALWNTYASVAVTLGYRPATYQIGAIPASSVFPNASLDLAHLTMDGSASVVTGQLDGSQIAPQQFYYRVSTVGTGGRSSCSQLAVTYTPSAGASPITATFTPSTTATLNTHYAISGVVGLGVTSLSVSVSGDDANFVYTVSADPPRAISY